MWNNVRNGERRNRRIVISRRGESATNESPLRATHGLLEGHGRDLVVSVKPESTEGGIRGERNVTGIIQREFGKIQMRRGMHII